MSEESTDRLGGGGEVKNTRLHETGVACSIASQPGGEQAQPTRIFLSAPAHSPLREFRQCSHSHSLSRARALIPRTPPPGRRRCRLPFSVACPLSFSRVRADPTSLHPSTRLCILQLPYSDCRERRLIGAAAVFAVKAVSVRVSLSFSLSHRSLRSPYRSLWRSRYTPSAPTKPKMAPDAPTLMA